MVRVFKLMVVCLCVMLLCGCAKAEKAESVKEESTEETKEWVFSVDGYFDAPFELSTLISGGENIEEIITYDMDKMSVKDDYKSFGSITLSGSHFKAETGAEAMSLLDEAMSGADGYVEELCGYVRDTFDKDIPKDNLMVAVLDADSHVSTKDGNKLIKTLKDGTNQILIIGLVSEDGFYGGWGLTENEEFVLPVLEYKRENK